MVTLGRFELPTCGLGNRRSIHLSYRATSDDDSAPRREADAAAAWMIIVALHEQSVSDA